MPTKLTKWFMYAASYSLLCFLICIRIIFAEGDWNSVLKSHWFLIIAICAVGIFLLSWTQSFFKWNMNERIKVNASENITFEMLAFLVPYIITMATITIDFYGIVLNASMFFLLGIAFVALDKVYFSLIFISHGYKLYKTNDEKMILCRLSKEQLNIKMIESIDGLECREIGRKIFLIRDNEYR